MNEPFSLILNDFDNVLADSSVATQDSDQHLYEAIKPHMPHLTWEEFQSSSPGLRKDFGSLTQAWQFKLDLPNKWCFDLRHRHAKQFIDNVIAHSPRNPAIIAGLEEMVIEHNCRMAIFSHNLRYVIESLNEHFGYTKFFPRAYIVGIEELNNVTKTNGLSWLYAREHFAADWNCPGGRHMLDDGWRNLIWAKRTKTKAWCVNPKAPAVGSYDMHLPTYEEAVIALNQYHATLRSVA